MKKSWLKILFVAAFIMLSLSCFADQNVIESISISKSNINVTSNNDIVYKVHNINNDASFVEFKNASLAQNASVNYDNGTNIQSAILKQRDNNTVEMQLKGKNIKDLNITFAKNQKIIKENIAKANNTNIPIVAMFLIMLGMVGVVLKSLTSKIEVDYNNIEIVRSINNTKSLKITADEYKKARTNYSKTKQNINKKEYVTQVRKNKLKKADKNIENPISI